MYRWHFSDAISLWVHLRFKPVLVWPITICSDSSTAIMHMKLGVAGGIRILGCGVDPTRELAELDVSLAFFGCSDILNITLGTFTIQTSFSLADYYLLRFIYGNNAYETASSRCEAATN
jgi:hypothetical protein